MSESRAKSQATIVAVAPLFLLAALAYHPFIADLTDPMSVAGAMSADVTRWGLAHFLVGIGFGLVLLAFLAVRSHLREAGEERWSALAVPFVVLGTTLFIFLPAFEMAMSVAAQVGADPVALQEQLRTWFLPIMAGGALTFGPGAIFLAVGVVKSRIFTRELAGVVAAALVVVALTRFVPRGEALYAGAVAGVIAFLPLAAHIWNSAPRLELGGRTALAAGRGDVR